MKSPAIMICCSCWGAAVRNLLINWYSCPRMSLSAGVMFMVGSVESVLMAFKILMLVVGSE